MTFGLYPYVFLVTRQAFLSQGQKLIEAAAMLGSSKWRIARRVVIPLSLPWIAGSGLLVAMETLADYGTVAIFNYDTLTTAVVSTWFSLYSKVTALKVAGILLLFVLVFIYLERRIQPRQFESSAREGALLKRRLLNAKEQFFVISFLLTFLAVVLIAPMTQLLFWSSQQLTQWNPEWLVLAYRSVITALSAGIVLAILAVSISFANRRKVMPAHNWLGRVSTFGYAFPGRCACRWSLLATSTTRLLVE